MNADEIFKGLERLKRKPWHAPESTRIEKKVEPGQGNRVNHKRVYPLCLRTKRSPGNYNNVKMCKELGNGQACVICVGVHKGIRLARFYDGKKCYCGTALPRPGAKACRPCDAAYQRAARARWSADDHERERIYRRKLRARVSATV